MHRVRVTVCLVAIIGEVNLLLLIETNPRTVFITELLLLELAARRYPGNEHAVGQVREFSGQKHML